MSAWEYLLGFEAVSMSDWPGKHVGVFFFKGCNMRCPSCHNWQIAWGKEERPVLSREKILDHLARQRKWLDGIVLSGGEASCVPGLEALIRELRALGYPIKLDTNGLRPEVVAALLEADLVELFAVDVKGPYEKYPVLTGGTTSAAFARQCLEEIFALARAHKGRFLFRCTEVPLLTEPDIQTVQGYIPSVYSLVRQAYREPVS